MSLFYSDLSTDLNIDYCDLVKEVNNTSECGIYVYTSDYYEIFKSLIISLVYDIEIYLLDSDFTKTELDKLVPNIDLNSKSKFKPKNFTDFDSVLKAIKNAKKWKLNLFTSGTTGLPKKIIHDFESLTRNTKISEKHSKDVWGFAYNPTHMAGLQVFFQAMLNKNSIVRLFNLNQKDIYNLINHHKITHISATPTFFRLMLNVETALNSVKRITTGGEKVDLKLNESIERLFPNALLLNIYASTEAGSVLVAKGENFTIEDGNSKNVKIENGELYLHKQVLGSGVEKNLVGDWYATGDLVEKVKDNPMQFKFISRKNEMINVGGYKVNPNEVEEVLVNFEGILDARVFGRSNSVLGNILCAEIVKVGDLSVPQIRKKLAGLVQEFKIPRMIKFVDQISKTRTGKKRR